MKTLLKLFVCAAMLSGVLNCSTNSSDQIKYSNLERQVDSLVQLHVDSGRVAGVSIAVAKGDSIMLHKSYGYADLEFRVALPENAIFGLGSMTKQFTAVAILQLAEQGKLKLDENINQYVSFNTRGNKVSIRNLLSHTSGIREYGTFANFEDYAREPLTSDSLMGLVEKEKFDFPPGELELYSNSGYHLLGLIAEKVSGMSYADYVRINFFEKLGMKNSSVCDNQSVVENQAHGYRYNRKLVHAPYLDHHWTFATGSICSTTEDFIKWNNALHNGKLLSPEMYRELISPVVLTDGTKTRYARGLTIWESHGRTVISHGGKLFGFASEGRYFPDQNLTFVALMNTLGPVTPEEINDIAVNALLGNAATTGKRFDGDLSVYFGTYEGYGKGTRMVVKLMQKDSVMIAQFGTGRLRPLEYKAENTWSHERDLYYFLMKDGKVSGLKIDRAYDYYILDKVD